ncbi:hypothetical protein ABZ135_37135 [Streptomyces sp. NPDC006339]
MALKISWLNHAIADAGLFTLYWFPEEADEAEGAGGSWLRSVLPCR